MKTKLLFPGLILLMISCNTAPKDDKVTDDTLMEDTAEKSELDTEGEIWKYDYNQQTDEFELKQLRSVDRESETGETLEKIINKTWPRVQIKFLRSSNDTAFIAIPDSKVLTQQMGSAGAHGFMISTTFSFTELKGINYVSFDFEEGDHAMPGVYDRNSWDDNENQ